MDVSDGSDVATLSCDLLDKQRVALDANGSYSVRAELVEDAEVYSISWDVIKNRFDYTPSADRTAPYTLFGEDENGNLLGRSLPAGNYFIDVTARHDRLTKSQNIWAYFRVAHNTPATGAPTISGTAQVGQTLTASTTGISDSDGLTNPNYSYQWLADDTNISGATSSTYTLEDAEEGKAIKVTVTFTDDRGNSESLTSVATSAVAARPPLTASFLTTPTSHDGSSEFTFDLRFSETPKEGFSYRTLRDHAFTTTRGVVVKARRLESGKNVRWEITIRPSGNSGLTVSLPVTTDCSAQGAICTDDGRKLSGAVELTVPVQNFAAAGAPAISGTAKVGETLTASTTGISDANGMTNTTYSYQWLADDAEISGATNSTYTLTSAEEGKAIKVRVSFNDDAGYSEILASVSTSKVAATPLTATFLNMPGSHDGSTAFTFELRFSETPHDGFSYKTLRDHAFTTTGGDVAKARRLEPGKNVRWEITVRPTSNSAVTIVLPVTTDCDATGAICTGEGRKLSSRLEATVPGAGG